MDLTLHSPRFPSTLEKWYIDALLEDGAVLLVYLGVLTLFGVRIARLTAELFPPHGPVVSGSATVRHISSARSALQFGSATLTGNCLRFRTDRLSGDLLYEPRYPPCLLREPFLTDRGRALHWAVEIPDADVTGTLAWSGNTLAVAGRGYRDRVWFDCLPWRFPIRDLRWGRAIAGEHAATWVRAATKQGVIAASWLDGHILATGENSAPPAAIHLGSGRVFLDADVAALEGLRLSALRSLLRRLSGDLHETKWQAPCTIAGVAGMAVHERVQWRA
jgi:hypothetical protein